MWIMTDDLSMEWEGQLQVSILENYLINATSKNVPTKKQEKVCLIRAQSDSGGLRSKDHRVTQRNICSTWKCHSGGESNGILALVDAETRHRYRLWPLPNRGNIESLRWWPRRLRCLDRDKTTTAFDEQWNEVIVETKKEDVQIENDTARKDLLCCWLW